MGDGVVSLVFLLHFEYDCNVVCILQFGVIMSDDSPASPEYNAAQSDYICSALLCLRDLEVLSRSHAEKHGTC